MRARVRYSELEDERFRGQKSREKERVGKVEVPKAGGLESRKKGVEMHEGLSFFLISYLGGLRGY